MKINFLKQDAKENISEDDWKAFQEFIHDDEFGFLSGIGKEDHFQASLTEAKKWESTKNIFYVGIGGSSLGPEMLLNALGNKSQKHFEFLNNIDPDQIERQLVNTHIDDTLIVVVSKTGGTAETIACFSLLINHFKNQGIDQEKIFSRTVFITDPIKSQLKDFAEKYRRPCLPVPSNIGGRYSVLTPVGLFLSALAGHDLKAIQKRINQYIPELIEDKNKTLRSMANLILEGLKNGQSQTVLMPYSSTLRELSSWFVQLWSESLGKESKGLTPVPAYGATDQHSQMQLFMEGPEDKLILLLHLESFKNQYSLSTGVKLPSFEKLEKHTLNDLMEAEYQGTKEALLQKERAVVELSCTEMNESEIVEIILFLECLTVLVGKSMGINPFDQPGVELGKTLAFQHLAKGK